MSLQPFELVGTYRCSGDVLGHGSFSTVCKGHVIGGVGAGVGAGEKTGSLVAIKILNKTWETQADQSPKLKKQLEEEIRIMKETNHVNVLRLLDVSRHPKTNQLCLIMEYCEEGDLEKYVIKNGGNLGEQKALPLFKQFALGMKHLYDNRIIHRDLKPENLLLGVDPSSKELVVKIADFGLARSLEGPSQMAQTQCGTYYYMAPEILKSSPYTYKADLWSIGVILYRVLTGKKLFTQVPSSKQLEDDSFQLYNPNTKDIASLSIKCQDILRKLLKADPEQRISWDEFYYHPFLGMGSYPPPQQPPQTTSKNFDTEVQNSFSSVFSASFNQASEKKQKNVQQVLKIANDYFKLGKINEAFVIYIQLMIEIRAIVTEVVKKKNMVPPHNTAKVDIMKLATDIPFLTSTVGLFDEIKMKVMEMKRHLKESDEVRGPMRIIMENVVSKGLEGAKQEQQQNWNSAADLYYHAIACLQFMERYATSVEQYYIFKYMEHLQYRWSLVLKKSQLS